MRGRRKNYEISNLCYHKLSLHNKKCHYQNHQKERKEGRQQRWKSTRNLQDLKDTRIYKRLEGFRWQEMEDGERRWAGKTECRKGIKEETSKSWLQMRMQGERESLLREAWLSSKWLNLWGENEKDRKKARRQLWAKSTYWKVLQGGWLLAAIALNAFNAFHPIRVTKS